MPSVAILAFDGISPFHLSVPCAVFGSSALEGYFELLICAESPGALTTSAGFGLHVHHGLEALLQADVVVVPSWCSPQAEASADLSAALRAAHAKGAQIIGLCIGSFVVAQAGLLDARRASTHWRAAEVFAQRFPHVALDANVLYVDEGDVMTSAGTAAGIDCCLHFVRKRLGAEAAARVARHLVVPPHRQGGQAQYIEQPIADNARDDRLADTLAWARANLDQAHTIDSLAARALMSRRTFTRRFHASTGTTVNRWITEQRLGAAQRLLESSDLPIDQVAARAGFGSAVSLRQHFVRTLQTSPLAYRRAFKGRDEARPVLAATAAR